MKALSIRCGMKPREIEVPETPDLEEWQKLVGGHIEPFDGFIAGMMAYVNADGLATCIPNRAVYATKAMEEAGYLSQMDFAPVKEGDLYAIVFGDFVVYAGSIDDDGTTHVRDMSAEEIQEVVSSRGISDETSGILEALRIATEAREAKGDAS